jgi:uncharacterized phage-associated protein
MSENNREAFAAANYIIENLSRNKISDLTNLKLQKLMYFAYGVHLSLFGERLFRDEIQAWKLGPVIPSVYKEFKDHRNSPIGISSRATILKDDDSGEFEEPPVINEATEENKAKSLFIACASCGEKSAWNLVDMLHNGEKSAWKKHYDDSKKGIVIPDEDILTEFESSMDQVATFILG